MLEFVGRWRIQEMTGWTKEFIDMVEPGHFYFSEDSLGTFVFGNIRGVMDVDISDRISTVEFSWLGGSKGNPLCGRGKFFFPIPGQGEGTFFIHTGGRSSVTIYREM